MKISNYVSKTMSPIFQGGRVLTYSLFVLLFFVNFKFANSEVINHIDKRTQSIQKNIKHYYLDSIVSSDRFIPSIETEKSYFHSYETFFKAEHPYLFGALEVNDEYKLYDISKLKGEPTIYWGSPAYLKPEALTGKNKTIKNIEFDINLFLQKYELDNVYQASEIPDKANIFIIPVSPYSYIRILNPNVVKSPLIDKNPYGITMSDIKETFFNTVTFSLHTKDLEGAYIKNDSGEILASFCPVDATKDIDEIEADVFYCVVQSLGLPGFYTTFQKYDEKTISWGNILASLHSCQAIKPKQNFFKTNFDSDFFEKCLNEESYKNADRILQ